MLDKHSADYFIEGILTAGFVSAVLATLIFILADIGDSLGYLGPSQRVATSILISMLATMSRPLLLKFCYKPRRNVFLLTQDLSQIILGRAVGTLLGVMVAIETNSSLIM